MKEKIKKNLKKFIRFITNPRLLLCVAIAWFITNGWSYAMFGIGFYFKIDWMTAVAGAYLAFLWLPISPEKIVTIAIALWLLKRFFPNDEKTLAVLINFHEKNKRLIHEKKKKRAEKKKAKALEKRKNN